MPEYQIAIVCSRADNDEPECCGLICISNKTEWDRYFEQGLSHGLLCYDVDEKYQFGAKVVNGLPIKLCSELLSRLLPRDVVPVATNIAVLCIPYKFHKEVISVYYAIKRILTDPIEIVNDPQPPSGKEKFKIDVGDEVVFDVANKTIVINRAKSHSL